MVLQGIGLMTDIEIVTIMSSQLFARTYSNSDFAVAASIG